MHGSRTLVLKGRRAALAALTGLLLTLAAQPANAECSATGCENARILQLYTEANGNIYVQLSGTMSNLNCTRVSGVYVTLQPIGRFKEIYATLLATQIADRTLHVRINDGSAGCTIAYVNSVSS